MELPSDTITASTYPTTDTSSNITLDSSTFELPDPTALGLSNARSYALQTIFLNDDIPTFLTTFNLPISSTLPKRLDIPRGVSFRNWLRRMLRDPPESVPPSITAIPTTTPLGTIYGEKLDDCFKGSIHTVRLKPRGTYPETTDAISAFLEAAGVTGDLYRGTSRHEARCALQEFKPAPIECTDLGKGLYTSGNIELALGYAGPCGVVWVFKPRNCSGLTTVSLTGRNWEYVASGVCQVGGDSDAILGAISEDRGVAGMQGCESVMGPRVQVLEGGARWLCWRTKKGRDMLAEGLVAMVFLDPEMDGG